MKQTILPLLLLLPLLHGAGFASEAELPPRVSKVLQALKLPEDSLSIRVDDVDSGETVLRFNADRPRNPASTIKLLTTLVALDTLGPAYRWRTEVYALGEIENGRLNGDLLIKGYGDPFLVTERVWQLLRNLRRTGLQHIDGDLLIDDSYFAVAAHDPGAFDRRPLRAYNVAPNALLMNFKVVRYWFEPEHDKRAVRVRVEPPLDNLQINNRLSLADGRCRGYQRGIRITPNEQHDQMELSGRFPAGCKRYAMDRSALSHNAFAFGLFAALWRESGGTISGSWRNVALSEELEPLLTFGSLSLAESIARINKHSNNVMARQLMYTLSAEVNGAPGTEEGGRELIADWLSEHDIAGTELILDNGAGLSRKSRMTADNMAAMLRFAWRQPYMPEYLASMSLSGLDGTLKRRLRDPQLAGKAHLKTGSLDHVTAIAGYLQSRSGRRYAVVAMQNYEDVHRGTGEEVQEALLRWLYDD